MGKIILSEAALGLETRRKTAIVNHMTRSAPLAGHYEAEKAREKQFPRAIRRRVGPCNTYNCHGFTFGARRTAITFDVRTIIDEDDYSEVPRNKVLPGDIAVYFASGTPAASVAGDIEHTGVVIEKGELGIIRLVSKWGYGDEWVHFLADCPYDATNVKFYRITDCSRL